MCGFAITWPLFDPLARMSSDIYSVRESANFEFKLTGYDIPIRLMRDKISALVDC